MEKGGAQAPPFFHAAHSLLLTLRCAVVNQFFLGFARFFSHPLL
jgi:hypothetical protein